MNEYKKFWKVTIVNREDEENKEVHNRVEKTEIKNFLNSFRNHEEVYFIVEHLTKEEYEDTEK